MTDQLADAPIDTQYHIQQGRFQIDFAWRTSRDVRIQHFLSSALDYIDKAEDVFRDVSTPEPPKAA